MRSLWRWIIVIALIGVADVVVLQATGNGNSGKHDSRGQILGFWIFVLSVLAVVSLTIIAVVRRRRRAIPGSSVT